MRNKLFLIASGVLLVSSLVFSGCFSSSPTEDQISTDDVPMVKAEGVLRVQTGVYAKLPGTHYLERDGQANLPVSSLIINLSSTDYLNKEVAVEGLQKEDSAGDSFLEIQSLEVTGDADDKTGWDVYKDVELGFRIAYRKDWEMQLEGGVLTFMAPLIVDSDGEEYQDLVVVQSMPVDKDLTLEEAVESISSAHASKATISKVGVDQLDALKVNLEDSDDLIYYVKRLGELYKLTFDGNSHPDSLKNKNTFHEMLLDFQFIAKSDSSDADVSGQSDDQDAAIHDDLAYLASYIKSNPAAFDGSLKGTSLLRAEFAGSNYVYIDFVKDEENQRILYKYNFDDEEVKDVEVQAKYEPGKVADWDLVEGSSPVSGEEKVVFKFADSAKLQPSVVKAGFQSFESTRFGFRLQYPASWYYMGRSSDIAIYSYAFGDQPVDSFEIMAQVEVYEDTLPPGTKTKVHGLDAVFVPPSGSDMAAEGVYVDIGDYTVLYVSGSDWDIVKAIGESIELID